MLHSLILASVLNPAMGLVALDAETPKGEPATRVQNKKLVGVLRNWLRDYLKGKYAVGDDYKNIAGKSLGKKAGLITKAHFQRDNGVLRKGQFSYHEEIELLLKEAPKSGGKAMAQILLQYCAVGLDDVYKDRADMVPFRIRELAEGSLREIADPDAQRWVEEVATGKIGIKVNKKLFPALQAAAVKVVGAVNLHANAGLVRAGLESPHLVVRTHAAEVLSRSADAKNLAPLVNALEKETNEYGKRVIHLAIAQLITGCRHKVDKALREKAGNLLQRDLGQPVSWQYQMQLVELARFYSKAEFVPILIGLLERYTTHPQDLAAGKLSGILRHTTHVELTKMTNAFYAMDDIKGWKDFWEREKDGFKPAIPNMKRELLLKKWQEAEAKRKAAAGTTDAEAGPKREPTVGMSGSDFFGIPVTGSNILFVVDTGQGMRNPTPVTTGEFKGRWPPDTKRIDAMKIEAERAVSGLTPDTVFNVLAYTTDVKAAFKKSSPATKKNIKAAIKFAKKQSASANYNLSDALVTALGVEELEYGRAGNHVDEIFVLCNHRHQYGAIKDPSVLTRLVAEVRRFSKVRINTVFIGTVNDEKDKSETGKKVMEEIAKITDGKFVRP